MLLTLMQGKKYVISENIHFLYLYISPTTMNDNTQGQHEHLHDIHKAEALASFNLWLDQVYISLFLR